MGLQPSLSTKHLWVSPQTSPNHPQLLDLVDDQRRTYSATAVVSLPDHISLMYENEQRITRNRQQRDWEAETYFPSKDEGNPLRNTPRNSCYLFKTARHLRIQTIHIPEVHVNQLSWSPNKEENIGGREDFCRGIGASLHGCLESRPTVGCLEGISPTQKGEIHFTDPKN